MRIRLVLPPLVESQKPAFVGSVLLLVKVEVSIANLLLSNPVIAGDDVAIVKVVPVVPTKPGTAPAVFEPVRLVTRILNVLPLVAVMLRALPDTTSWS